MINKNQRALIVLAICSVCGAVVSLLRAKSVNSQLQKPDILTGPETTVVGSINEITETEELSYLASDFEGLLSGEGLAELYEGQEDFGFTSQE